MQDFMKQLWDEGSSGSGFVWLDAVEQYVSQVAILVQNIERGALLDISTFTHSGHTEAPPGHTSV